MAQILRGNAVIEKTQHLTKIALNADTWETTFRDEASGEIWLMDYPESGYHGGGSPRLTLVETE